MIDEGARIHLWALLVQYAGGMTSRSMQRTLADARQGLDPGNMEREFARLAAQHGIDELEPWVRSSHAPAKTCCNVTSALAIWLTRPLLKLVPLRLRLRLVNPFFAHLVELGGELRANLLVAVASFDQNGDGLISNEEYSAFEDQSAKLVAEVLARLSLALQVSTVCVR